MAGPPKSAVYTAAMSDRKTLCLASANPGFALHRGDDGFRESVQANFDDYENTANEKMAGLKAKLPNTSIDEFWNELMEGITEILGAQYAICSKRIIPDDPTSAVEMPKAGAPGACMNALAFFCNDGTRERMRRDLAYDTYGGPCAHMKHDKTFVVPTGLQDFLTMPKDDYFGEPMESYIGVPLFEDGKCFGHIGAFWTVPGSKQRKLSWGFIEMALRALEDVVSQRVVRGQSFLAAKEPINLRSTVIPNSVVAAMKSLKPYARSLSHELRTPMHGVVGMLDIMYATVQEALESPMDQDIVTLLRSLRENIETIQDSSKRAVEAADNVVHAYDLNMEVPDLPSPPRDEDMISLPGDVSPRTTYADYVRPVAGVKRKSHDVGDSEEERSPKQRAIALEAERASTPHTAALRSVVHESNHITSLMRPGSVARSDRESSPVSPSTPGMKITRVREVIRLVVNESLRFGGRPDSAIASETDQGESIEVRNRTSSGEASTKTVEWAVEPSVPEEMLIDERDFAKLISVLFLNALKFTSEGYVKLHARLSSKYRYLVITVVDTGGGIPPAFRPFLFKAFAREDDSLTRQNEGLGLGLMVAKGVARRIGGDLICLRSDTEGPHRGSEFELRMPLVPPTDAHSRHSSPSRAPTPLHLDDPQTPVPSNSTLPNGTSPRPALRKLDSYDRAGGSVTSVPANLYTSSHIRRDSTNTVESDPRRYSLTKIAAPAVTATQTITSTTITATPPTPTFDRHLATKYPLNVLVAEDNRINRKLLINMLKRLGYTSVQEAYDGTEAVRLMELDSHKPAGKGAKVDVILMDLWMPNMDGYEAARQILSMRKSQARSNGKHVKEDLKILAVSADVTDEALDRAKEVGMIGFMTKPYRMLDLERLLVEYCSSGAS